MLEHVRGRPLACGPVEDEEPDERREESGGEERRPLEARLPGSPSASHPPVAAREESDGKRRGEERGYEIAQRNER